MALKFARCAAVGDLPMNSDTMELRKICHEIVFRVAARCFNGGLPDDPHAVVGSILQILPADTPAERLEEIMPYLYSAVLEYQCMEHSRYPL